MRRLALPIFLAFSLAAAVMPARAADDPYTVKGIVVDATAASAIEAQAIAINAGRAKAWAALYRRLTKAQDWPRQPSLDDVTLQRMIRNYLPTNERRSTTRYVANMSYAFNPDAVRRILRQNNIAYADMQAHPILVIPMAPGYEPHGAWTTAWANPRYSAGSVPLILPRGDGLDASALGTLNYSTSAWQDVEPVASRAHAQEAFLALLQPANGQLIIKLKRLAPANSPSIPDVVAPIPPKTAVAKAYAAAADSAANAIIDTWKARAAVDYGKRAKLVADMHIDSLGAWNTMMQKLGTVPTVTDVAVVAMNTGQARIAIGYVGTSEQLSQQLSQSGFELSNDSGAWWLSSQTASPDTSSQ